MTEEPAVLAARAARTHVVVIGGGIGGLVAARECAKVGMRVTVLEAADAVGGAIRRATLDDVVVDAGAESFATRGGHVRALVEELGLSDRVVSPAASSPSFRSWRICRLVGCARAAKMSEALSAMFAI